MERFIREQGIVLPRGSEAWRRVAHAFLRANVQYSERVNERLAGQWRKDQPNGAVVSPAVSPAPLRVATWSGLAGQPQAGPPVGPQVDGERLSEIYAKYKQERRPSAKTEADWNAAIRRFTEVNGDLPVRTITRTHVREFKDHLLTRPGRARERAAMGP